MSKSKTHEVIVKLRFDKAIPRSHAVYHAKQYICGTEYPYDPSEYDVQTMKITTIKSAGSPSRT